MAVKIREINNAYEHSVEMDNFFIIKNALTKKIGGSKNKDKDEETTEEKKERIIKLLFSIHFLSKPELSINKIIEYLKDQYVSDYSERQKKSSEHSGDNDKSKKEINYIFEILVNKDIDHPKKYFLEKLDLEKYNNSPEPRSIANFITDKEILDQAIQIIENEKQEFYNTVFQESYGVKLASKKIAQFSYKLTASRSSGFFNADQGRYPNDNQYSFANVSRNIAGLLFSKIKIKENSETELFELFVKDPQENKDLLDIFLKNIPEATHPEILEKFKHFKKEIEDAQNQGQVIQISKENSPIIYIPYFKDNQAGAEDCQIAPIASLSLLDTISNTTKKLKKELKENFIKKYSKEESLGLNYILSFVPKTKKQTMTAKGRNIGIMSGITDRTLLFAEIPKIMEPSKFGMKNYIEGGSFPNMESETLFHEAIRAIWCLKKLTASDESKKEYALEKEFKKSIKAIFDECNSLIEETEYKAKLEKEENVELQKTSVKEVLSKMRLFGNLDKQKKYRSQIIEFTKSEQFNAAEKEFL